MKKEYSTELFDTSTIKLSKRVLFVLFCCMAVLAFLVQFVYGMTQTVLADNKKLADSLKTSQVALAEFKSESERKDGEIDNLLQQYQTSDSNLQTTTSNLEILKITLEKQKSELAKKEQDIKKLLTVQKKTDEHVEGLESQLDTIAESFTVYKTELSKEKKTLADKEKSLSEKVKVVEEEEVNLDEN